MLIFFFRNYFYIDRFIKYYPPILLHNGMTVARRHTPTTFFFKIPQLLILQLADNCCLSAIGGALRSLVAP